MERANESGIVLPELLVPNENINMAKWSVIAVDQFTSQPEYWEDVARFVGRAPSMLHIVLPEIYLGAPDVDRLIEDTKFNMKAYLKDSIFRKLSGGVMLTERVMNGVRRKGVLLAVDLEKYDYRIENRPLVRATERTLLERIPPRVRIREGAAVESPHVLVLMDDRTDSVIGPLYDARFTCDEIYDFELMQGGGKIRGYYTKSEKLLSGLKSAIDSLPVHDGMKFCVGDGNHSLATAKAVWDKTKENINEWEYETHPLRFALCEFVNIHDPGVEFMPIHRVLFKVNPSLCLQSVCDRLVDSGIDTKMVFTRWTGGASMTSGNHIPFLSRDSSGYIALDRDITPGVMSIVQEAFDSYVRSSGISTIDYIHGTDAFESLSTQFDAMGFFFSAMDKDTFFETVIDCGVLPKKTFSMGEAEQKRYYLECRKISTD